MPLVSWLVFSLQRLFDCWTELPKQNTTLFTTIWMYIERTKKKKIRPPGWDIFSSPASTETEVFYFLFKFISFFFVRVFHFYYLSKYNCGGFSVAFMCHVSEFFKCWVLKKKYHFTYFLQLKSSFSDLSLAERQPHPINL